METKRKTWAEKEEQLLKRCLETCETKAEAFRLAAEKLGRSAKAVEQHYYSNKHVLTLYKTDSTSTMSKFIASLRNIFTFK